jgi:hypothetical protein
MLTYAFFSIIFLLPFYDLCLGGKLS